MKFRNTISSLIFGLGCALSFIGAFAIILPMLPLPQLQLVLASFSMPSDNIVVTAINTFVSFVLAQSWQTLATGLLLAGAGSWLLSRFSPKAPPKSETPVAPIPVPEVTEPISAPPESNPFAIERPQEWMAATSSGCLSTHHPKPILEPNKIPEEESEEQFENQPLPYISSRFSDEIQAIESASGPLSQSGSRILIRTSYEAPKPTKAPAIPEITQAPQPALPLMPSPEAKPAVPEPSARIRSTVGRRSSPKNNLIIRRS